MIESPLREMTDPYAIGEAIAAQVIQLADRARAGEAIAPTSAGIIRNVADTALSALDAGRKTLEAGDTEAALFAIAAAHGACTLIAGLVSTPDDPLIQMMSRPFVRNAAMEAHQ